MRSALVIFAAMVIAQWFVPWRSIGTNERVLEKGVPFRFRTAPVDPHDPMRGEYVILRFALEDTALNFDNTQLWDDGREVCVLLRTVDGYASIDRVQADPPTDGTPYLWCASYLLYSSEENTMMHIDLPFDRFYLAQGDGRRTENLMTERVDGTDMRRPTHAKVYVYEGEGVIADLIIDGRSIKSWLRDTGTE